MLDLLLFCLVVFGTVNIITVSKIGAPWRKKASEINTKLGDLFHCPMCMGFWVGLVLSFWKSPTDFILFDAIFRISRCLDYLLYHLELGFKRSSSVVSSRFYT